MMEKLQTSKVVSSRISVSYLGEVASHVYTLACDITRSFVCIANVHMVVTAKENELLRSAMEAAAIVTSDGMPLVWELRRQGFKEAQRVSGLDLMIEVCDRAQSENLPIYFYGGSLSVAETMRGKLGVRFPKLTIAGIESPPMLPDQPEVDQEVVERIKASGARIVFIGLGCPKQELWMHAYSQHIPAVLIGVGAAFDFFTGTVKRAPLWMQKSGLEWFFRMLQEPKRLWKRYFITNSFFIWYLLVERVRRQNRY